jgi:hypothetical protein
MKPLEALSGINSVAINAAMAMLHQGRYKPKTNERSAVKIMATRSFILLF